MLNRTQRTALRPMAAMAESIAELRATGQHELADALTRLREDWARAAARYPHRHSFAGGPAAEPTSSEPMWRLVP